MPTDRGERQLLIHESVGDIPTSPEGKASCIMSTVEEVLKSIDRRLASIEGRLARLQQQDTLTKASYSCDETAQLTSEHGIRTYRPFTIRLACKDGRIPEAEKLENGNWRIPKDAVQRVLDEGIPPEQRHRGPVS